MIRLSELKLPLSAVAFEERRAADAPAETEADRQLPPHPIEALQQLAASALGVNTQDIAQLSVFKRSFDARKKNLLVVYIVDVALVDPAQETALLAKFAAHSHIQATPHMAWEPSAHGLPIGDTTGVNAPW